MLRKLLLIITLAIYSANTIAGREIYGGFLSGKGQLFNKVDYIPSSPWYCGGEAQAKLWKKSMMSSHMQLYFPKQSSMKKEVKSEDGQKTILEYGIERNISFLGDGVYKKPFSLALDNFKGYFGLGGWGSISFIRSDPLSDIQSNNKNRLWDIALGDYGIILGGGLQHNFTKDWLIDASINGLFSLSRKTKNTSLIRIFIGYRVL